MPSVRITLPRGASAEDRRAVADGVQGDVIVNLVKAPRENWSFAGGLMSSPPAP